MSHQILSQQFHSRVPRQACGGSHWFLTARAHGDCKSQFDPEIVAHAFICMTAHHGLLQVLFDHHPSGNPDEVMAEMVDIFMRGICK